MVDNTKLAYYSNWDIDQLVDSSTIGVSSGDTIVYTITNDMLPVYEVQFQPSGSDGWFQEGSYSTDGTLAGLSSFYSYILDDSIYISVNTAGTARVYVWSDRVDN